MQAEAQPDLCITRQPGGPRNVQCSASCPPALKRTGLWRVEDFDLHKQLYKGKASLLYSASCRKSNMQVAIKVYRKARLSELNWYQVEREIRIHSSLDHENIIQLYAAFEDDANVYMVQEYATGGDLYEDLRRRGGKYEEVVTAAGVMKPCIEALMYLHSKGIIHRDIKPENILLMADRSIKLADFGLSINATFERPVTRAGTLDYMAPEVLLCPEKSRPQENKDKVLLGYTSMVDAWAMGILAYELIVGRPPFEKQSRAATYEHIMYRKPECPASMSAEAKDFVFAALTKAARKRPALTDLLSHAWLQSATQPTAQLASGAAPATTSSSSSLPSQPVHERKSANSLATAQLTGLSQVTPRGPSGAASNSPAALPLQPAASPFYESGPTTPGGASEGKPFMQARLSPCTTSSDEANVICDPAMQSLPHLDSRSAVGQVTGGAPQRAGPPLTALPSSHSGSKKSNEEGDRQQTWGSSLKRGMLRMLSKTPPSRSHATADPQRSSYDSPSLAPFTTAGSSNEQALRSAGLGLDQADDSALVRPATPQWQHTRSLKPNLATSSHKRSHNSNSSAGTQLSPVASQALSDHEFHLATALSEATIRGTNSLDVRPASLQTVLPGRARAVHAASPFSTEHAQSRSLANSKAAASAKARHALADTVEEADPLLRGPSSGPLPPSMSMGTMSTSPSLMNASSVRSSPSLPARPLLSPSHSLASASSVLGPHQPSQHLSQQSPQHLSQQQQQQQQSGQTMQQMILSIRQGSGKTSTNMGVEDAAVAAVGQRGSGEGSIGSRQGSAALSPFQAALAEKDYARGISHRCVQGGAGVAAADDLRGATSSPINFTHRANHAYMGAYNEQSTREEEEEEDDFDPYAQLSPLGGASSSQLMKRSQSLALPANMVIEPGARSASNRNSFKRAELAKAALRPQMQSSMDEACPLSQRKPTPVAPRKRLTNQNLEPGLSSSWGLGKGPGPNALADSPRIRATVV